MLFDHVNKKTRSDSVKESYLATCYRQRSCSKTITSFLSLSFSNPSFSGDSPASATANDSILC